MAGKKKKGSKQKKDSKQQKPKQQKKEKKFKSSEKKTRESSSGIRIMSPDLKDKKITGELKRMRFITPYNVSLKFNITISIAKNLLKKLKENGEIQLVSGDSRMKIYKPITS